MLGSLWQIMRKRRIKMHFWILFLFCLAFKFLKKLVLQIIKEALDFCFLRRCRVKYFKLLTCGGRKECVLGCACMYKC